METTAPLASVTAVLPARSGGVTARRTAARVVPQRSDEFVHLSLDELRDYRRTLTAEEDQVSYWRRIIQARLDVLRAGTLASADGRQLQPILTDFRVAIGRTALVNVVPVDDIPPLPNLAQLWERRISDGDDAGAAALDRDLAIAEQQLSEYRQALHGRIADATGELIARYREQPELCLTALPLRRERPVVPT